MAGRLHNESADEPAATRVPPQTPGPAGDAISASGVGFRRDVQGLRAVAVLAAVLYHAGVPGVTGGFVGVDVFFVISGFLITGLLWRELAVTSGVSLARFYARRVRRLLPAAAVVLVVTLIASSWLLDPLRMREVARDAAAAALYAANYRFAMQGTDYLAASGPPSPVQHFWSLGIEEQFYLVWPVLLLAAAAAARPRRLPRAAAAGGLLVLGGASLALSVWLTGAAQPWAFYSLPSRAFELAAGGVLALAVSELRRLPPVVAAWLGWAGLSAVLWSIARFGSTTAFPGWAAVLPVAGTVAVLAAGCAAPPHGPEVVLRARSLQSIGRLSYCWYLWHWPVLILGATLVTGAAARAGLVLLSWALAAATTRRLEEPVRHARALTGSPRRSLLAGSGLTATAALAALAVAMTAPALTGTAPAALSPPPLARPPAADSAPPPAPPAGTAPTAGAAVPAGDPAGLAAAQRPVLAAVAAAVDTRSVPANLTPSLARAHADKAKPFLDGCDLGFTDATSPPCVYGDRTSTTRVITFGDSHAAQWWPALDAAARQQHWRLENLTKATCPPLPLTMYSPVLHREFRECENWRAAALDRIRAEHPALVVVDMARHYGTEYHFTVYSSDWIAALSELTGQLRATGAPVMVLGPTPKPPGDLPACLTQHLNSVPACTAPLAREVNLAGAQGERAAVQSAGGVYVDVAPWICTDARCAVVIGNLLVFRDDNHVTTSYAAWLTPVLTVALDQSLRVPPG